MIEGLSLSPAEVSRIFAIVFMYHHKQVMRQALSFFLHLFLNLPVVFLSLYPTDASHSQVLSSVDIQFSKLSQARILGTQPQPTQSQWVRICRGPMAFSGHRFSFPMAGHSQSHRMGCASHWTQQKSCYQLKIILSYCPQSPP